MKHAKQPVDSDLNESEFHCRGGRLVETIELTGGNSVFLVEYHEENVVWPPDPVNVSRELRVGKSLHEFDFTIANSDVHSKYRAALRRALSWLDEEKPHAYAK